MRLISGNLGAEFRKARQEQALGTLRSAAGGDGPYSYLAPSLVREPAIVSGPMPVKVGHGIANLGNNAADSSYLTGVEKRAISKYAGRIQYAEPEMMGPLFDPINWFLPWV